MNTNFFNNKYNLIICSEYVPSKLSNNVIIRRGNFEDICFTIKQEELNNDEVFSGNIIVNNMFKKIYFDRILKLMLNDNMLYTIDFEHTPYTLNAPTDENICWCSDDILYCSSFVLWILGNRHRTKNTLYGNCRLHRIELKEFNTNFYEEML